MSKVRAVFSVVFSFALLSGLALLAFYLLHLLGNWYESLKLSSSVTQALVAGLFGVLGLAAGKLLEHRRDVDIQLREQKIPIYEEFLKLWFRVLSLSREQAQGTGPHTPTQVPEDLQQSMVDMAGKLLLWGSNGVIEKYSAMRRSVGPSEQNAIDKVFEFEDVLTAVRKDLGHSTWRLRRGTLLALFISDIDEVLKGKRRKG